MPDPLNVTRLALYAYVAIVMVSFATHLFRTPHALARLFGGLCLCVAAISGVNGALLIDLLFTGDVGRWRPATLTILFGVVAVVCTALYVVYLRGNGEVSGPD